MATYSTNSAAEKDARPSNSECSRREFIQVAGALAAVTAFSPSVFGQDADVSTERRKTMTQVAKESSRYDRGLQTLRKVGGEGYDSAINSLKDVAPDLGRFTVEFAYGDVISRPILELRVRELVTVAGLAALGNARPQLKYHINGALNVGATKREVVEVIYLVVVFAGFPAALNAISAAREVFQGRPDSAGGTATESAQAYAEEDRYRRGSDSIKRMSGGSGERVVSSLKDIAPDLGRYVVEFAYGDILSRSGLDLKTKELVIIAASTALGTVEPQLKVHIQAALNVGGTWQEVTETIIQMAVYAGFPAALNGINAAREVFEGARLLN